MPASTGPVRFQCTNDNDDRKKMHTHTDARCQTIQRETERRAIERTVKTIGVAAK